LLSFRSGHCKPYNQKSAQQQSGVFMKYLFLPFQIVMFLLLISCASIGKKTPEEIVLEVILKEKSSESMTQYIVENQYSKEEIQQIAQQSIDKRQCDLGFNIVKRFQLDPNIESKYNTLFQCLMLNKSFSEALSLLESGAAPDFIRYENVYRNNSLEEASAWGATEVAKKLVSLGEMPTSRAYFLGVSGEYHSDYDKSVLYMELYETHLPKIDLEYVFNLSPLLYKIVTKSQYTVQQKVYLSGKLLEQGADPNSGLTRRALGKPERNITYVESAYMAAASYPELSSLLLSYGANLELGQLKKIAVFLANLEPGDQANQGMVVEINNNLVLVQSSEGSKWVRFEDIRPSN